MSYRKQILVLILLLFCFQTAVHATWTKHNSGTLAWLRSIYFLNEEKGWIVGSRGTFLVTLDGGKSWKQTPRFTEDSLLDVYFTDEQTGWVLCERNIFNSGALAASYLMKTADGGQTWERAEFDGGGRQRLARLFFTRGGYGYAIGESGALFAMQDDRKRWKRSSVPSGYLLLGGVFIDEMHGAVVGGGRTILFTEDAGLTWNKATVQGQSEARLNSIFFANQRVGWTVGAGGKIYTTANGGRFWREQNSNTDKNLLDVFFLNTAEGWAVGDGGTILHTTTAGNVWSPVESGLKHKIEKIRFAGKKGFAVGFGGTILRYDADEATKKVQPRPQLLNRN